MKTAEELLANNIDGLKEVIKDDDIFYFYKGVVCEFAKEFARRHVKAALKKHLTFEKNQILDRIKEVSNFTIKDIE